MSSAEHLMHVVYIIWCQYSKWAGIGKYAYVDKRELSFSLNIFSAMLFNIFSRSNTGNSHISRFCLKKFKSLFCVDGYLKGLSLAK
jgi:hypothetical protein